MAGPGASVLLRTTLGQFVLHLAEVYDGLIDMGGAIRPPLKPVNRARLEEWLAASPKRARERQVYIYEIEYTAAAGHRCVSHIVDTTFFRAWMAQPNFYMVK